MTWIIISCIILFLPAAYIALLAPGRYPKNAPEGLWTHCYAHRGLHAKDKSVPENSLAAFSAAAEAGYGMELDINLTKDGQVVVFHDDSLKRVCGVDKLITDCTYPELLQYRLHDTEQKIPLLTDVLSLVAGRAPLIVELKVTRNNRELCQKAAAILDSYAGPYCIESFHPGIVRWFYKNRPQVVRGQLAAGFKDYSGIPAYQALLLSSLLVNAAARPHFAAYKHEDSHGKLRLALYRLLGGKLVAWTVRDGDDTDDCKKRFDVIIFEFFRP